MVRPLLVRSGFYILKEENMDERDNDTTGDNSNGSTQEGSGHSSSPQVQTPDKPSQAEGDRDTIDESIKEKQAGDS